MVFQYLIYLNFSGLMNSTLSKNGNSLIVWNYQGYVKYIHKISSMWTPFSVYNPYSNIQAMNSVTLSENGTLAIL